MSDSAKADNEAYIEMLKVEREVIVKEHTALIKNNYYILAGPCWDGIKRLNREIKRAERKGFWL